MPGKDSKCAKPPRSEGYVDGKGFSIMQRPQTPHFPMGYPAEEHYSCEVGSPSLEVICTATLQLRNNRAPGLDGIQVEAYETCLDSLGPWLYRVITKV